MSRSNDAGHFFQTTEALATTERKASKSKNKRGNPIKLPSKLLAVTNDSLKRNGNAVFVAEAAGEVKRVVLEAGKIERVFSHGTAPITCLALCTQTKTLFAGSWDKTIYAIPIDREGETRKLTGHADFVKCLLSTTLNGRSILLSGGADACIIVWDVSPAAFGKQIHKLKGHAKALQDLTIDPLGVPDATAPDASLVLFTASSDREIRRWFVSLGSAYELPESVAKPILAHETSIYKLQWDSEGDLWTASADKTAKHLVRARDWESDTVLEHPDFVRDVAVDEARGLIVTACRDEEVRVWDMSSGKLVCTYTGHFEEVSGLVTMPDSVVASVSIDGTVRQWGLSREAIAHYQEEIAKEANGEKAETGTTGNVLTEDEEAELAELMDDDDD